MSRALASADQYARYYPIDELLEMPVVRILRTLRRFDRASIDDLRVAMNVEDDLRAANRTSAAMTRLVREGCVERSGPHNFYSYRITDKGRRELEGLLARGSANGISGGTRPR